MLSRMRRGATATYLLIGAAAAVLVLAFAYWRQSAGGADTSEEDLEVLALQLAVAAVPVLSVATLAARITPRHPTLGYALAAAAWLLLLVHPLVLSGTFPDDREWAALASLAILCGTWIELLAWQASRRDRNRDGYASTSAMVAD